MFSNSRGRYICQLSRAHARTKKHQSGKCDWPATPPASTREPLPVDLLLEIVARSDATSIIRCTRASKFLRGAILDPAFRRRLALQAPADGGSFDPALLFGVSYLTSGTQLVCAHHIVQTPSSIQVHGRLQASSLRDSFQPVASRGCLLLLCRYGPSSEPPNIELLVCDTTTRHLTSLPIVALFYAHAHAFLSVSNGDAGCSYELIIADHRFRFQTLSSKHGQWDAVREASVTDRPHYFDSSSCLVIGRTVYWLCRLITGGYFSDGIIGLHIDGAEATMMELPPGFSSNTTDLLLASVRGRLSLLVAKSGGISMWTLMSAATWSRQLVIGTKDIVRPVGLISSPLSFVLEAFGERSGTVIVRVESTNLLLRLDLGTKVVSRLHHPEDASVDCLFLHETDLVSLFKKSL